jgi:histidine-containing phosphotransfer protein
LLQEILGRQFLHLEQLEDKDNPHFVDEVFTLYFSDSPKVIAIIEQAL